MFLKIVIRSSFIFSICIFSYRIMIISYELTFDESIELTLAIMENWFRGPMLNPPDFEKLVDPIYLKNQESVVTHVNQAYRHFFSKGKNPIGREGSTFLNSSISKVSRRTDKLLLDGIEKIQFDHFGNGPNDRWYNIRTFKSSLARHGDSAYVILGISRPISFEEKASSLENSVDAKFATFKQFSSECQAILTMFAQGFSAKEIAATLDLSSRTIENRRKGLLEELCLTTTVDIIKLLVRFEERGMISL